MRNGAAALGALLLIAAPLGAQQATGAMSHAVASPVLPDIVAVERTANDRQELQFVRLSNQGVFPAAPTPTTMRPGVVLTMPELGVGKTLSSYSGQLDWRPVVDQGRSWFAYVANDADGNLALMLNFIDGEGELARDKPIRIPFGGQVRTPRWSRDGKHLAFVSDSSILYVVSDVADALRAATAGTLRPTRVSAASRPALFPSWSPAGDHIAYGTEVVSGGRRNGAIEVLPINPSNAVAGVPVVVTGELSDDDEYRPSWSRDGKYIAFYADTVGDGRASPVSIGIVELVLNPRTGQAYRGIVREGSQRWLADDVSADDMRGPAWTSTTEGNARKDALVYVKRDVARHDPIELADLTRWLAQLPRAQYESAMSSASDAADARSVGSVEMNKRMRFVFSSMKDGSEVVNYRDVAAPWAQGPEPTPIVVAVAAAPAPLPTVAAPAPTPVAPIEILSHKGQDVKRALLFPGLGQFSAGQRAKGSVLAAVGVAGAGIGILGVLGMSDPVAVGQSAVAAATRDPSSRAAQLAIYTKAQSDFDAQRSKAFLGGAVFAASWLYGIYDAWIGNAVGGDVSLKVVPDRTVGRGSGANVGFSLAVGHLSSGW